MEKVTTRCLHFTTSLVLYKTKAVYDNIEWRSSNLSGEGENGQTEPDDRRDHDSQGLEQMIEVVLAQVGSKVVDEAVDLAETKYSQRLEPNK